MNIRCLQTGTFSHHRIIFVLIPILCLRRTYAQIAQLLSTHSINQRMFVRSSSLTKSNPTQLLSDPIHPSPSTNEKLDPIQPTQFNSWVHLNDGHLCTTTKSYNIREVPVIATSIPWAVRFRWLENTYSRQLFRWVTLTCKVGQTNLVFGTRSGFVSTSAHARLQVSVCSGYDFCHPG